MGGCADHRADEAVGRGPGGPPYNEGVHRELVPKSNGIAIIGSGRVAASLGRVLRERGLPVRAIASRDIEHARAAAEFIGGVEAVEVEAVPGLARRVLIAVSDHAIAEVAARLAKAGFVDGIALHTAGSRGPEALAALGERGVATGVLHPLQTFPTREQGAEALPGTYFAVTGDTRAVAWAREIVELMPGHVLAILPERWALYHAAAVMASNYQVTLLDAALEILEKAGVARGEGLAALAPIARATLENILRLGPRDALTGPISRGDGETVRRNLEALGAVSAGTRELYRAAGRRTLALAERRGLAQDLLRDIEKLL
jgi:predicted short-subunit dehydrogenase-like oxidoreductase (DUF2520 family)